MKSRLTLGEFLAIFAAIIDRGFLMFLMPNKNKTNLTTLTKKLRGVG